jgi:S-adenosylmethionine hydrolase
MAPIITLLTDFGSHDAYVAEMKATLLAGAPNAVLVDITHEVVPGDVRAAQYLLDRAWRRFPTGTVHLVVVDPGVGTARRALAASAGGHFFVAPDNGILTPVLDGARVMELAVPRDASPTFHGRDVFAPAAARLAAGGRLAELGVTVEDALRLPIPAPRELNGALVGEVVYVDRFGTLITNFPEWMLSGGDRLLLGGSAVSVGRTFGDVERGALVAFVGSGGTVEIAVRDGSAARTLGVGVGGEVRLERRG